MTDLLVIEYLGPFIAKTNLDHKKCAGIFQMDCNCILANVFSRQCFALFEHAVMFYLSFSLVVC